MGLDVNVDGGRKTNDLLITFHLSVLFLLYGTSLLLAVYLFTKNTKYKDVGVITVNAYKLKIKTLKI